MITRSSPREVIIKGVVEEQGIFHSSFEADNSKLHIVFNHRDGTTLKIDSDRTLGKSKDDMSRTRLLFVLFTSEWDARKCLSKSYKVKNYHERVFISKSLNKDDQAAKRKLQKRYEMINTDRIPRKEIKIKGLKHFRNGTEDTLQKWLQIEVCLLNVQSKISLQQRLKLLNFSSVQLLDLISVTETWLYPEIEVSETFPLKCNNSLIARRDHFGGEHGGVLNAAKKDFSFNYSDLTLKIDHTLKIGEINDFAVAISIQSSHMFLLIYNPTSTSPYRTEVNLLVDRISSWHAEFDFPPTMLNSIKMFSTPSPF